MAHPVSELMATTMEKIRSMMDANTVVGTPIETANGITLIPISKISIGFGSGGSDFATKNQKPEGDNAFGGGGGMGVTITPLSFLVVKGDTVRMLTVNQPSNSAVDRVIDMVPDVVDKVSDMLGKKKGGAAQTAADEVSAAAEAAADVAADAAQSAAPEA